MSYPIRYVTIPKLSELTGYTIKAIEMKIQRGVFAEGIHYIKSPDNRVQVNLEEYEKWLTNKGKKVSTSTVGKSVLTSTMKGSVAGSP